MFDLVLKEDFQLGIFLHGLLDLNLTLSESLFLIDNFLLFVFDQRQEHLALLVLFLVELGLELDLLTVEGANFLMELLVHIVDLLELLLYEVELFVKSR